MLLILPIQAIDLDGKEARYIKEIFAYGTTKITITVDLKVKNSSGRNINNKVIQYAAKIIAARIENMYSKVDEKTRTTYMFKVNSIQVVNKIDPSKDFSVELVSWEPESDGSIILGRTGEIGNAKNNVFKLNINACIPPEQLVRTSGHELGHELGMRHPKNEVNASGSDPESDLTVEESPNNLIRQSSYISGTDVIIKQLNKIIETIDKAGQGTTITHESKPTTSPSVNTEYKVNTTNGDQ